MIFSRTHWRTPDKRTDETNKQKKSFLAANT